MLDITFMHCDHVPRCTGAVDKVFEGYSSIQFMASGKLHLAYGKEEHDLCGAWAWAAWPGPHIVFRRAPSSTHWDHRYLAFRGPRVDSWLESGLLPKTPHRVQRVGAMSYDFDRLTRFARRGDDDGRRIAMHLAEALLLTLKDGGYGALARGDLVTTVDEWLYERRCERPDYGEIARSMHIAESTLRRLYRRETGVSLHARYLAIKLDAARELIADPRLSIKEIAYRLGYSDVYYFSKQFRRYFGVPPATFRRSIQ